MQRGALILQTKINRNMTSGTTVRLVVIAVLAWCVLMLALVPSVGAQGCAMCYQSASATGPQGAQALRHGILILLFPTLTVFTGIFALIYRRRNVAR
jgi:hypothetical protein